eukprot:TRINITY_DN7824_c0_g1_i1.p1 TRINITY_DN7824_c0_g1~~TRINITY_DN7824_c0_g1_i1.p1  ORF type:complete len:272 (+),score=81.88 TRINITY_DN7824_c0_g1_i1:56-871(+)
MGGSHSHNHNDRPQNNNHNQQTRGPVPASNGGFHAIKDNYRSLDDLQEALRAAGLESSNLIIGVDYTKSNTWSGKISFGGKNLHTISQVINPYQEVIQIIGKTLEPFDDDKLIPAFGFGDITTGDKTVFPFWPDRPSYGFEEVLNRYTEISPQIQLSGPTSFAPIIRAAIDIVRKERSYHILVIIADGQVDVVKPTVDAIVDATNYPLSIVCIGVGDGPWDRMREFDDGLPARKFDNFQFVPFNEVMERAENREVTFAVAAMQEIPEQALR